MARLLYWSDTAMTIVSSSVVNNMQRYESGTFEEYGGLAGWNLGLECDVDVSLLEALDGTDRTAAGDLVATRIVMAALKGLSPALANEPKIWVRLAHLEGLAYTRERWLSRAKTPEQLEAAIRTHMFGASRTGIRDDHALARLWWTGFIAKQCCNDLDRGLSLIFRRADVRANLVERPWLLMRQRLARSVFREMDQNDWVLSSEGSFRLFMKQLNLRGAGVVFEAWGDSEIDSFVKRCAQYAENQAQVGTPAAG